MTARTAGNQAMISIASVPRPGEGIASVEIDGEGVLFDPQTNGLHILNPTALVVWDAIDGTATVGELATQLAEASGADPEVVREGVLEVVRDFASRGLLAG